MLLLVERNSHWPIALNNFSQRRLILELISHLLAFWCCFFRDLPRLSRSHNPWLEFNPSFPLFTVVSGTLPSLDVPPRLPAVNAHFV